MIIRYRMALVAVLALSVTLLSACDLTELNENPNEPSEARTTYLMTNVQGDLAQFAWDEFYYGRGFSAYAQYWSEVQYTTESRYEVRDNVNNNLWSDFYTTLTDLEEIKRLNRDSPGQTQAYGLPANQIAVAQILQARTLQIMTDIWGPIPLSEAFQGRGNTSPTYDSQEAVYTRVLELLTQASSNINTDAPGFTSGDLIYGGDMAKWKKLANSLKMRAAIRIADRKPGVAETAINEALAAGVMESNADNALIQFTSSAPYYNPIHENEVVGGRDDFGASESIMDLMNEYNDPRRGIYFDATSSGDFVGFPFGLSTGAAQSLYTRLDFSQQGALVTQADANYPMMLYDEVEFIKAEAAARGFTGPDIGNAQSHFEDAITASMEYWGVTDAGAISSYIGQLPALNSSNYKQVLGEQKWLALYMQGIQGWSEWRRLDFEGVFVPPRDGSIPDFGRDIAIRYPYPVDEFNLNGAQVRNAVDTMLGGDGGVNNQGQPLWWDVNN